QNDLPNRFAAGRQTTLACPVVPKDCYLRVAQEAAEINFIVLRPPLPKLQQSDFRLTLLHRPYLARLEITVLVVGHSYFLSCSSLMVPNAPSTRRRSFSGRSLICTSCLPDHLGQQAWCNHVSPPLPSRYGPIASPGRSGSPQRWQRLRIHVCHCPRHPTCTR